MASYDQLSAQQRAIVDLILKRGQSYGQLADTLGMPEARVRELAGEALTSLAPVSAAAVETDRRAQIADYLLGQQDAPDAASTRGHLRRSEAARAWSRSVLDSLEHLYPKGELPTIPSGEDGAEPKAAKSAREPKPSSPRRELSPEAAAIVRRRRIAGIAAGAVALLFALLIWPIGLLSGDDSDDGGSQASSGQTELVGQALLRAVPGSGANRDRHAGLALVTERDDKLELAIEARLPPTKRNQAYEVWLYDSPEDAVSLGAQITDRQGAFAGRAELPDDYRDYRFLEISRETVDDNPARSGNAILRTRTSAIRPSQGNARQNGGTTATP
jgi:hypothetical protein